MRDNHHYVIDEQSQLPPHLMPPPYLVNIDAQPYPIRQQEALLRLIRPAEYVRKEQRKEEMEDYDQYMKKRLARVKREGLGFGRARHQVGGAGSGESVSAGGSGEGMSAGGSGEGMSTGGSGEGVSAGGSDEGVSAGGSGDGAGGSGEGVSTGGSGKDAGRSGGGVSTDGSGEGVSAGGSGDSAGGSGEGVCMSIGGSGDGGEGVAAGGSGEGVAASGSDEGVAASECGESVSAGVSGEGNGCIDHVSDPHQKGAVSEDKVGGAEAMETELPTNTEDSVAPRPLHPPSPLHTDTTQDHTSSNHTPKSAIPIPKLCTSPSDHPSSPFLIPVPNNLGGGGGVLARVFISRAGGSPEGLQGKEREEGKREKLPPQETGVGKVEAEDSGACRKEEKGERERSCNREEEGRGEEGVAEGGVSDVKKDDVGDDLRRVEGVAQGGLRRDEADSRVSDDLEGGVRREEGGAKKEEGGVSGEIREEGAAEGGLRRDEGVAEEGGVSGDLRREEGLAEGGVRRKEGVAEGGVSGDLREEGLAEGRLRREEGLAEGGVRREEGVAEGRLRSVAEGGVSGDLRREEGMADANGLRREGGVVEGRDDIMRGPGAGGVEQVNVMDVEDGQSQESRNMQLSLVYSLGLDPVETKRMISLWQNRVIVPPLDPAHLGRELARREELFQQEHQHFEAERRKALLREAVTQVSVLSCTDRVIATVM